MPATYEPISTQTIGTAVASVTFSSIPQTYTDLVLVFAGSSASLGTDSIDIQFNGDTTTNYSNTFLSGNGSSASSGRNTGFNYGVGALITSTEIANSTWNIFNYTNTTTFKTVLVRGNIAGALLRQGVTLWRKTPEAITSILLKNDTAQNFAVGCTFTLYGIKAA
jgi:hypothetical protein